MTEAVVSQPETSRLVLARLARLMCDETTTSLIATGLIAAHLLDDSFVEPEPGTAAGDHVMSGVTPVAVLVFAAVIYPHLRAGFRAVVALLIGSLGIVAGATEGGYHLVAGGFSGDDGSGLVSLLAGGLLVTIAAVCLWKARRLDESRGRRYVRRSLTGIAAGIVFFEVVFPILFAYGYTHFGRSSTPQARLGVSHENVTFRTSDGLRLAGWYVPSRNRAAVIVLPASGRSGPLEHVRMLARHGYGVLIFDPRGTGQSEGDPYRWGADNDVKAALDYLHRRPDVDARRIGGLGLSLGGELMLQTAGETDALNAVVSEGAGIRSIREEMLKPGAAKWLAAPFWVTQTAALSVFSNQAPPPNLQDQVARISPRPFFLIYSGHPVGGEELNKRFYEAAGRPKALWKIDDARHTGGLETHPREYEHRVVGFFDAALLDRRQAG
jgi:pimeloyl-ACP methyl ester carboxylesterase